MQSREYCVPSMRLKFKPSSSFISNDYSVFGFPITNFRIFHQRDFSIVLAINGSWHDFGVPITANDDGRFRIILYMDFINRISFTALKCVGPLYFFHLLFSLFSLSVLSVLKRTSNIYRIRSSMVLYFWNFWPFVVYKSIIRFAIFLLIRCPACSSLVFSSVDACWMMMLENRTPLDRKSVPVAIMNYLT